MASSLIIGIIALLLAGSAGAQEMTIEEEIEELSEECIDSEDPELCLIEVADEFGIDLLEDED